MSLNKEFFKETSTSFPKELRDQVLCFTFILKADTCGNTGTIANMVFNFFIIFNFMNLFSKKHS